MEDGARTLREQRAAYDGMQERASEDAKRGGTAGCFVITCPGNLKILIAGLFFNRKVWSFYVLFFIELAPGAKEDQ